MKEFRLDQRYTASEGKAYITGVQAAVRGIIDVRRHDQKNCLNTAAFVSGYQGSPLGGLDIELFRLQKTLDDLKIVFHPGLNEDLAATSVYGSQILSTMKDKNVDGVSGFWYGKAPGVDRSADVLRHANIAGCSSQGGAVLLVGDDPAAKSSTLPSATETLLSSLHIPVLYPAYPWEVRDYIFHALQMSRACGLWVAVKIVTAVADGAMSCTITDLPEKKFFSVEHVPNGNLLSSKSLPLEESLINVRLPHVNKYVDFYSLNETYGNKSSETVFVSSGKTFLDLWDVARKHKLDEKFSFVKLACLWPNDNLDFLKDYNRVVVCEEKDDFIETQIKKNLFYSETEVYGKTCLGKTMFPSWGELDCKIIEKVLCEHNFIETDITNNKPVLPSLSFSRVPAFCSGCPHNISTKADDEQLVGAGIGCHTMILLNEKNHGQITGLTQMGGEGAQWIGQEPFLNKKHSIQNLGDGTFHHSASLAVRAACNAKVNITYKLLWNEHVSMTGGQAIPGQLSLQEAIDLLEAEGVKKIIVTSKETVHVRNKITETRKTEHLQEAIKELSEIKGTTVLIHVQECAAEKRRKRKKENKPENKRVWINERLCEGCGDCGEKSSCLSVTPKDTFFGRKTEIHQSSCNSDFSCLQGDCPSFMILETKGKKHKTFDFPSFSLPEPKTIKNDMSMRIVGIGGTGIVTLSQILGVAGMLEGLEVRALDQTGLSQKGGPVVSDISFLKNETIISSKAKEVSLVFSMDMLSLNKMVEVKNAQTNLVLSSSKIPTIETITNKNKLFDVKIEEITKHFKNSLTLNCEHYAQKLFSDHMAASMILLGAAAQKELLPVSVDNIEKAINLNKTAAKQNIEAFKWGRYLAENETLASNHLQKQLVETLVESKLYKTITQENWQENINVWSHQLFLRGGIKDANFFIEKVEHFMDVSKENDLIVSFAKNLYKLMAYKDEYEIARLFLDEQESNRRNNFYDVEKEYFMMQPPMLRKIFKNKIKVSAKAGRRLFKMLYAMRKFRNTKLDIFGSQKIRKIEKALIKNYLKEAFEYYGVLPDDQYKKLLELPDMIRGYEYVKEQNILAYEKEKNKILNIM